jgi:hypothetical protein
MPCYFLNPVLLHTSDCTRTVCIHCRIDIQPSVTQAGKGYWYEQMLVNAPKEAARSLFLVPGPLPAGQL